MDEKEFDYINVIPFVDIMLVLLTIVLTTSTFIATGGIPVNLPQASRNRAQTLKVRTIEIDAGGKIFFLNQPATLSDLRQELGPIPRDTPFLIRADRRIPLQTFVDVLDLVKNAGFRQISLQTETKR
jgi:biopolymer transport protein ExbD